MELRARCDAEVSVVETVDCGDSTTLWPRHGEIWKYLALTVEQDGGRRVLDHGVRQADGSPVKAQAVMDGTRRQDPRRGSSTGSEGSTSASVRVAGCGSEHTTATRVRMASEATKHAFPSSPWLQAVSHICTPDHAQEWVGSSAPNVNGAVGPPARHPSAPTATRQRRSGVDTRPIIPPFEGWYGHCSSCPSPRLPSPRAHTCSSARRVCPTTTRRAVRCATTPFPASEPSTASSTTRSPARAPPAWPRSEGSDERYVFGLARRSPKLTASDHRWLHSATSASSTPWGCSRGCSPLPLRSTPGPVLRRASVSDRGQQPAGRARRCWGITESRGAGQGPR